MFHVIKEEPEFWGWRPRAVSHMVPDRVLLGDAVGVGDGLGGGGGEGGMCAPGRELA